jgi:hypothetical protein
MSQRHGLSIGFQRADNELYLSMRISGKLTHEDYEIIFPVVESAVAAIEGAAVKVLVDLTAFEGWEIRAAWDDLKLGLKHGKDFEKIAIYGNENWEQKAARIGSWFISGEIEYFEKEKDAIDWLTGPA